MAWIKSDIGLIRHRKVIEPARELRIRRAYMFGHLHALWHAALEQQEDGDLSLWSDQMIAESSDYPGDAPQWVRLLQKYKLLDGKLIHDWLDYAGDRLITKHGGGGNEKGKTLLVEIWKKHGRPYGKPPSECLASNQRVTSECLATLREEEIRGEKRRVEKGKGAGKGRVAFAPPTLQEVQDYCRERRNGVSPQKFVDFYQSKGWLVGKSRMKDWQAAVRTWEGNSFENAPQPQKRPIIEPSNAYKPYDINDPKGWEKLK